MIDTDGYRPNVAIILINNDNKILWARRKKENSWQIPQGGIKSSESVQSAMYRELYEELGLLPKHVEIINSTSQWLFYDVPSTYKRNSHYKGQKQIYYTLKFIGEDYNINLKASPIQEFDAWRWEDCHHAVNNVIYFKQEVYSNAFTMLNLIKKDNI